MINFETILISSTCSNSFHHYKKMRYSEHLRKLFPNICLTVEDLFLLETFQIKYLPERVPKKEFSALLRANPIIHRFLVSKHPPIKNFVDSVLKENNPITDKNLIEEYCQELLWEIGELFVYNKYPEVFDADVDLTWKLDEIIPTEFLKGKTVIDAGAGSGRISFRVVKYAETVYAVEPASSFRGFIRKKANRENINNLFVTDGFLNLIPLPDNSADVLITSNAIGWELEEELKEIERVLKPNAYAIHLFRNFYPESTNKHHDTLVSPDWIYICDNYTDDKGLKLKYSKTIIKDNF